MSKHMGKQMNAETNAQQRKYSLSDTFARLRARGERAFMPYVCCGDFGEKFTESLIGTLCANGADVIELGIPFSDPVADGPTIQAASVRALGRGMTPGKALGLIARVRKKGIRAPIVVMAYYNLVFRAGVERFARDAARAGASAILCPDVPLEESGRLRASCANAGLDCIFLAAPNTPHARLGKILANAGGFLYLVSVSGTTGARKSVSTEAMGLVKRAKRVSKIPVAVGFGVSTPKQAREIAKAGADGAIVGSKIVDLYAHDAERGKMEKALGKVAAFSREMKAALSGWGQSVNSLKNFSFMNSADAKYARRIPVITARSCGCRGTRLKNPANGE
jgi:tryptophan synthase alpha chain